MALGGNLPLEVSSCTHRSRAVRDSSAPKGASHGELFVCPPVHPFTVFHKPLSNGRLVTENSALQPRVYPTIPISGVPDRGVRGSEGMFRPGGCHRQRARVDTARVGFQVHPSKPAQMTCTRNICTPLSSEGISGGESSQKGAGVEN